MAAAHAEFLKETLGEELDGELPLFPTELGTVPIEGARGGHH